MGRELRHVPLDFDWPWTGDEKRERYGGGVWPGYMFTHNDDCAEDCVKSWHQDIEPPAGDGFQLWETTSEGSPISPVFPTLDALCEWAEPNATTFADFHTTAAEWKRMLERNFVETYIGTAADGTTMIAI